jgi:hypothetical protein
VYIMGVISIIIIKSGIMLLNMEFFSPLVVLVVQSVNACVNEGLFCVYNGSYQYYYCYIGIMLLNMDFYLSLLVLVVQSVIACINGVLFLFI